MAIFYSQILKMNIRSSSQLIEFEVNWGAEHHYHQGRDRTAQQTASINWGLCLILATIVFLEMQVG